MANDSGPDSFFHPEAVRPSLEVTHILLAVEARRFHHAHVADKHRIRRGI